MVGNNSQVHLNLSTSDLNRLRIEAEEEEVSVAEILRRKITLPPQPEELIELRKLKEIFRDKKKWSHNQKVRFSLK